MIDKTVGKIEQGMETIERAGELINNILPLAFTKRLILFVTASVLICIFKTILHWKK